MDKDYLFTAYNPGLAERSRKLRREMTPQEKHLWYDFLRDYPVKFYRQRAISTFIADFYCSKAKLVIEIDGIQHETESGLEYDELRTKILQSLGLRVIRFSNIDVDCRFAYVCQSIEAAVNSAVEP